MSNNFAHKAAFNTTKAAYATGDAITHSAKAVKLFGSATLIGIKAGIAAAKAARNPANPDTAARIVAK